MNEQETIKKREEYKETHTKEEMIADFEDFFGLPWYYYDINCF